jgi:hypothetical protein
MPVWIPEDKSFRKKKVRFTDGNGKTKHMWFECHIDRATGSVKFALQFVGQKKKYEANFPLFIAHYLLSDEKGDTIDGSRGSRIAGVNF